MTTSLARSQLRQFPTWMPVVLIAVWALVLSTALIWVPGYWNDEAATISMTTRPWSKFVSTLSNVDIVHAAYYVIIRPWVEVFGTSTLSMRLPSAVAVATTSLALIKIGVIAFDRRVGYGAAVLYPAIPVSVWMAGEARSPALSALLVALQILLAIMVCRGMLHIVGWIALGLTTALCGCVFFFASLSTPALLIFARTRRDVIRMAAALAAGTIPVVPIVFRGAGQKSQVSWISEISPGATARSMFESQYFMMSTVAAAMIWAIAIFGVVMMLRTGHRRATLAVLAVIALPNAAFILAALAGSMSFYMPRYLAFTTPAVAMLLGMGATRFSRRMWNVAAVLMLAGLLAFSQLAQRRDENSKSGWLYAEHAIRPLRGPGDAWITYFHMSRAAVTYESLHMPLLNAGRGDDYAVFGDTGVRSIPEIDQAIKVVWYVPAVRSEQVSMEWVPAELNALRRQGFTVNLVAPQATVDKVSVYRAHRP
ncbi:glycosyltransferase family 39 protein [Gordonia sp. CPCC 205515]|uniref:glycosyltransferase family 39 protein n=1 Tax=Gordonia sp. CPCC 205515 TaxID=3140791 RepID=UPI003AF3FE2E